MRITEENADWVCNDLNPAKKSWAGAIWHEDAREKDGVITCRNCGETWKSKPALPTPIQGDAK